jgi:hypothetical protein
VADSGIAISSGLVPGMSAIIAAVQYVLLLHLRPFSTSSSQTAAETVLADPLSLFKESVRMVRRVLPSRSSPETAVGQGAPYSNQKHTIDGSRYNEKALQVHQAFTWHDWYIP